MAIPPLTEKAVYLALKDIFSALPTPPSTAKKIRKKIEKHKDEANIATLIQRYGLENITVVALALSGDQIFASTATARIRFPDVFGVLPSQPSQSNQSNQSSPPTTSVSQTVTSSAAAVERVGTYSPQELMGIGDRLEFRKEQEKIDGIGVNSKNQSYDSASLPLWDQHRILVRVQYIIEKACFTFAQGRLSALLQREGWDCAEAVELNQWARTLLIYRQELNLDDVKDIARPLVNFLESIIQLRHDAVHHVRLSSSVLLQRLTDAGLLAQLLQDYGCSKTISIIRQRTQDAIEELVRSKQLLDGRLADIKKEFAAKRAELERQEAELLEAAARDHKEPVVSVSGSLDRLSMSSSLGGTAEKPSAPWLRVYEEALPDEASSGSEDVAERTKEPGLGDEAIEKVDGDAEVANPLSVLLAPAPPVEDGLVEPVCHSEQEDVEKDEDKDPVMAEQSLPHREIEVNGYENDPRSPPEDPPISQMATGTDTQSGTEEPRKEPETTSPSESDDPDMPSHDKEALCEPSASPPPTCVDKPENNTIQDHYDTSTDDTQTRPSNDSDSDENAKSPSSTNNKPPTKLDKAQLAELIKHLTASIKQAKIQLPIVCSVEDDGKTDANGTWYPTVEEIAEIVDGKTDAKGAWHATVKDIAEIVDNM